MMRACVVLSLFVYLGTSLSSAQSPASPAFKHRAVVQTGGVSPEVVSQHGAVVERSLLIRDVAVVNHPDFNLPNGSWSFAPVIGRAFQRVGAGMPNAQSLTDQLRGTIASSMPLPGGILYQEWQKQSPDFALTHAPIQLLAIVNRVDLAQYDPAGCKADGQPGEMRGTEVRFVYAGLPSPTHYHYLSMIVEFVLPCLTKADFKSLAQDWLSLISLDWTPAVAAYQHKLEDILTHETSLSRVVRLRANGEDAAHTWDTREFVFSNSGICQSNLERQPNFPVGQCQGASTALGKFATRHERGILASNYEFDDPRLLDRGDTLGPLDAVLTLGKDAAAGVNHDNVRFALSLNSCTACHGPETHTTFHHINQRDPDKASALSAFLTGSPDCSTTGSTSLVSYCTVETSAMLNQSGTCKGETAVSRQFNDLLRRHLFIHTLSNLQPAADWKKALEPFTATQSH